jgi:glucose/arabinose dehydrogenase
MKILECIRWSIISAILLSADFALGGDVDWPTLSFVQITTNKFSRPTSITHAGDGRQRLFVEEQDGTIRIIQNGITLEQPFLDLTDRVATSTPERGLLGLAFPSGYSTKHHFYVNYTRKPDGATVISRFTGMADANIADPNSEQIVMVVAQATGIHNGGQIAFGPDGYLYVGVGDGGPEGDTKNHAQNPGILLGKILRIDVENEALPYAIPMNNPYVGNTNYAPEIWALGLRNPWRFSFDRATGDFYIGDVGQNRFEEIDFQPAEAMGGQNYSWRTMEGATAYRQPYFGPAILTNISGLTLPVTWYDHLTLPTDVSGSVTGGYVYRGPSEPRMNGVYFFGDYVAGWIWGLKRVGQDWQRLVLVNPSHSVPHFSISTFGEDEQGSVYLADYSQGKIFKLQDSGFACTPSFTPASGAANSTTVIISCGSTNAKIYYTTNGVDPTEQDPAVPLSGAISIAEGVTYKTKAFRGDLKPSEVATAVYTLKTGTPSFTPATGPITNGTTIQISTETPGATIYYTINDQTEALVYTNSLVIDGNVTLRATASAPGFAPSSLAQVFYPLVQVATPLFSPAFGQIAYGSSVAISCPTPGALIYYTLDGTQPTVASSLYTGPLTVTNDTYLSAFAVLPDFTDSRVMSAIFTVEKSAVPTFSPMEQLFTNNALISISCSTPGAIIHYTLDGTEPDISSPIYIAPLSFSVPAILRARSYAPQFVPSDIQVSHYGLLSPEPCIVSTVAGGAIAGFRNGTGTLARFSNPQGVCVDRDGNLYVADTGNNVIRRISTSGMVSTFAGSGVAGSELGQAENAQFSGPSSVSIDGFGNIYVADGNNCNRICKIDSAGMVTVFANLSDCYSGPALWQLTADQAGNIYAGFWFSVQKVTSTGAIIGLAGTGANGPGGWGRTVGPTVDSANNVYSATAYSVWKTGPDTATELFAGGGLGAISDGPRLLAGFYYLQAATIDSSTNILLSDSTRIRKISANGWVSTIAGTGTPGYLDGIGSFAQFNNTAGLCVDARGNIFVADSGNNCIRKIVLGTGSPEPLTDPAVTIQPVDQTVGESGNATFTVLASGTPTLTYQWQFNGVNLPGETGTSLNFNRVATNTAGIYDVIVSNSFGSVTSSVASLTVIVSPEILAAPVSRAVATGEDASFSIEVGGTPPLTYQWRFNGTNLPGETGTNLIFAPSSMNDAGNYDVVVSNSAGSVTSAVVVLTVLGFPTIQIQPVSQTIASGQSVSFSVLASGGPTLHYQWRFNGVNIPGESVANLTINSVTESNAGIYDVIASNSSGSVTSKVALLTVLVPPTIRVQPVSQTVISGQIASLSVLADGVAPLSYQWRLNGVNLPGETGTSLIFNPVTISDAGNYDVIVGNLIGNVISAAASLIVSVPPRILVPPVSQTAAIGQAVSLYVQADGTPPLYYQWRLNGISLPFETLSAVIYNPFASNLAGNYDVIIRNSSGSVTSAVVSLTVRTSPNIIVPPVTQTIAAGQAARFSVEASGTPPLRYQWQFNGVNLPGETGTTLIINSASIENAGIYEIVVIDGSGNAISASASLKIATPPQITLQPMSQTVTLGQAVSIFVAASGAFPLNFRWRFNGFDLQDQSRETLVINPATSDKAGNYDVIVSNSSGSVTSSVATITVVVPPQIVFQPASQTVAAGKAVSLSVGASGTPPLSYQWRFNGVNISGENRENLIFNSVVSNNAGNYDVIVANSSGSVTSSVGSLSVIIPLTITVQPASQTVSEGQPASFSVGANGTPPLSYQWRFNGMDLPGETATNLIFNSVTTNSAGSYDIIVNDSFGSVTSVVASLMVLVPPAIIVQPVSQAATPGQAVNFSAVASGTPPLSYQWEFNGMTLPDETGTNLIVSPVTITNAGSYDVVVSNGGGRATSAVVSLTVVVPPQIVLQPASQTIASGHDASFSVVASGTTPLNFQWRFNGLDLPADSRETLFFTAVSASDAGSYDVVVSNSSGSVTSAVASLSVIIPPGIIFQPASQTARSGQAASFSVAARGTPPLSYQWRFNGLDIEGEIGTILILDPATTSNAGNYDIIVSNSAGSVTSAIVSLSVSVPLPAPVLKLESISGRRDIFVLTLFSNTVGFTLESTRSLKPPLVWVNYTDFLSMSATQFMLTNNSAAGGQFFRLRIP